MDILPCMWQQNKIENTGRYRVEKLSSLLSEMQAGNANQRKTTKPKCKQETLISVKQLKTTVIKEPDAQTQSR